MSVEPRMQWTSVMLMAVEMYNHLDPLIQDRISDIFKILELGAEKHADRPHRGALEDIAHAKAHLASLRNEENDPETGLPHELHAAADCLLAFGHLVGLMKEGEWNAKD